MSKEQLPIVEEEEPQCKVCGASDSQVQKTNRTYNRTKKAMVQHYRCLKCGSYFTAGSWLRFRAPKAAVERAVDLYRRRYLISEIIETLKRETGVTYSYHTVLNWGKAFAPEVGLRRGRGSGPRMLAAAVRRLVTVDSLAAEMKVSPSKVEAMLARMEEYTTGATSVKLRREVRTARRMAKELARIVALTESLAGSLEEKKPTRNKHPGDGA